MFTLSSICAHLPKLGFYGYVEEIIIKKRIIINPMSSFVDSSIHAGHIGRCQPLSKVKHLQLQYSSAEWQVFRVHTPHSLRPANQDGWLDSIVFIRP